MNAILILSPDDGARILAKYYSAPHPLPSTINPANPSATVPNAFPSPYPTAQAQKTFEKGLVSKTAKSNSDIILYDNKVVVFKSEGDVLIYVVGGVEENEMLLWHVCLALRDSLNILLK